METQALLSNSSLLPSAKDLLYVLPRLAQRAIGIVPDAMDLAGKIWQEGGSMVADATGQTTMDTTVTNTSAMLAQSTATTLESAMSEVWREGGADEAASAFSFVLQGIARLKNFGGIFSYLTSRWALATFTAAVILNRTQFYASSREHLRLRWHTRLAVYMIPISAFLVQLLYITQALKCQTSPDFPRIRYGDPLRNLAIDFASEGGFLYKVASALVFWQDDATCCAARHMSLSSVDGDRSELRGSLSLLFWFFITLCTGQLFETLCCALQGKQPMPETGMTILEHSLAFAECEAMISSALGFGLFGLPKIGSGGDGTAVVSRGEIMQRLNVPPEVLLVCIISCFSHLSSAILAITGIRHKVRLVNTGIWALCYMSALLWSFLRIFLKPVETITDLGVLRFPTVCIVGFLPHILILIGITVCSAIYSLALIVTALSVPEEISEGMSFRERVSWAYSNLQANVQFSSASSISIKMSEDFYTTLLKIGFSVLTAASEAVYLNEGSRIQVANMTWLEQKRIDELAGSIEQRQVPSVPAELLGEGIARGISFPDYQNAAFNQSAYARERKSQAISGQPDKPQAGELDSGLGLTQRRSRMQLTLYFVAGILGLIISVQARLALNLLTRIGIERRPAWLLKAAGVTEGQRRSSLRPVSLHKPQGRDFWMVGPNGQLVVPQNDDVDVEAETRRRLTAAGNYTGEDSLSNQLYGWWQSGGWFGNVDGSGDYVNKEIEDDLTSMISMSTDTTDDRSDIDDGNSGRRTPTQEDPYGERETTPANDGIDVGLLSRLLNPQSAADREEARLLSFSLLSQRPMTRSQYRREVDRSRSQLLAGLRGQSTSTTSSEEEEERDLERFIMSQRSKARAKATAAGGGNTWQNGAAGMGEAGPQVGLAARNYNKCICCRTDIAAYSRLYVP
ncbi:hypothetical protein EJ03DRAFT_380447 [Teratosphaeria nubilosa]|uniref:Uncharacterized protein n=1 Tax=Teratosphaeria nubilosa TaxID=161662 RepID=A0A6G1LJN5_9PEZI|nr:hypothetical protein EJ03DRAFT_380447 [Teratosphaeria nubilosa]